LDGFRNGIDAVGTNHIENAVALYLLALRRVRNDAPTCVQRIIDRNDLATRVDVLAKVADTEFRNGYGGQVGCAAVLELGAFIGEEEECLVSAVENLGNVDRPADAASGIPLAGDWPLCGREGKPRALKNSLRQNRNPLPCRLLVPDLGPS
jgi:hypothetical protein